MTLFSHPTLIAPGHSPFDRDETARSEEQGRRSIWRWWGASGA